MEQRNRVRSKTFRGMQTTTLEDITPSKKLQVGISSQFANRTMVEIMMIKRRLSYEQSNFMWTTNQRH